MATFHKNEEPENSVESPRVKQMMKDAVKNDDAFRNPPNSNCFDSPSDGLCIGDSESGKAKQIELYDEEEMDGVPLDDELFNLLQKCFESPEFFQKLEAARAIKLASKTGQGNEGSEEEGLEDYVEITKQDAIDAMVSAIIANIVECPQINSIDNKELQKAVLATCETLKQGRMRRWMEWVKCAYRVCALGSGVVQVFAHPWIAKALISAVMQIPCLVLRFIF